LCNFKIAHASDFSRNRNHNLPASHFHRAQLNSGRSSIRARTELRDHRGLVSLFCRNTYHVDAPVTVGVWNPTFPIWILFHSGLCGNLDQNQPDSPDFQVPNKLIMIINFLCTTPLITIFLRSGRRSIRRPHFISPESQLFICGGISGVQILLVGLWLYTKLPLDVPFYPNRKANMMVTFSENFKHSTFKNYFQIIKFVIFMIFINKMKLKALKL